jgi:hypothetical protein
LRRFSSMTCITKWSLVRATKKKIVVALKVEVSLFVPSPEIEDRNEVDAGNWANKMQELLCIYNKYLAFLLYRCISINFVCLLLNKKALRNETSAVMNYITQLI